MIREIQGFHQDTEGDWVAELSCLHSQHVRHRPPFQNRPWVMDLRQRQTKIGTAIDCPLCDRAELPQDLDLTRLAGPWNENTLPKGLTYSHKIAKGNWGVLKLHKGQAQFFLEVSPPLEVLLNAGAAQPIPPEVPHRVTLLAPSEIIIEFWSRQS